jgi:hypothetical protein
VRSKRFLYAAILAGLPLFALGTCAYWAIEPTLCSNSFASVLMDAPRLEDFNPRTVDVDLIPNQLDESASPASVDAALVSSGFRLKFDMENAGPYVDPDYITRERKRGVSRVYSLAGRVRFPCGEEFFVEVGFGEEGLTRAVGYAIWTCL